MNCVEMKWRRRVSVMTLGQRGEGWGGGSVFCSTANRRRHYRTSGSSLQRAQRVLHFSLSFSAFLFQLQPNHDRDSVIFALLVLDPKVSRRKTCDDSGPVAQMMRALENVDPLISTASFVCEFQIP